MKLHPRTMMVQKAGVELGSHLINWLEANQDLTWLEVSKLLSEKIPHYLNYALRMERHPEDPEKKADEA